MNENLGTIIMQLRKERGMTQEQLANALGITFQAVSKWENGVSSPDISALPLLAELFGVSIDALFGRTTFALEAVEPQDETSRADYGENPVLPWPDDDTFYAVLYHGHSLIGHLAGDAQLEAAKKHFVFQYEGPAQNIFSEFSVEIEGEVAGSVEAGASINCGDVQGDVISGGNISCGDVSGSVQASGNVSCGDIGKGLEAGGNVDCGDVGGSVSAVGGASCADVGGNVTAGAGVNCNDVGGSVFGGTKVQCDSVNGTVAAGDSPKRKRPNTRESDEDDDLALDEMIDRQVKDSINLSMSMSDLGVTLGQKISSAVQKAMDFSARFGKRNDPRQDEAENE